MENSTTEATAKVTATIYTMPVGTVMPYMGTESNLANLERITKQRNFSVGSFNYYCVANSCYGPGDKRHT